jgi:hypothetical protein
MIVVRKTTLKQNKMEYLKINTVITNLKELKISNIYGLYSMKIKGTKYTYTKQ